MSYECGLGWGEYIIGWPTVNDIKQKIGSLIEQLGMNPNFGDEREEIKKYLAKAKAIADAISLD